ncbi:DEAD/DEAH box helicase [Thiorhodococcus minor]|uniref:DEAD/DEAH box helicase n=1 Tax=Thiorhodococcus minor TaxID=57489 RepID=A0A6M0K6E3_9GAMM|nr:DEAD/DEAH box helicase [Thiorhodococcus minor]NEV64891.1 DEAD/DEAH box helicase [Thiorhodococcus minor]
MARSVNISPHQSQFFAWELTRRANADTVESLGSTLLDAQVDLNPHQVEAALFACRNPLSRGVILADEVGLGKTVEAGLVLAQLWAERRRRLLIIVPANLRKQWHQELMDKFALEGQILESKGYNQQKRDGVGNPFDTAGPVICSYQFAKAKIDDLRKVPWDIVVFDEAHRLRNVYKPSNVIANTLKDGLAQVPAKVLLTATPLQNSLLELFGLVSVIDERVFGDLDSFRRQFARVNQPETFQALRRRIAPLCKRTLRKQVAHTISYTKRIPIVEEFTPSDDEQHLSLLVADTEEPTDLAEVMAQDFDALDEASEEDGEGKIDAEILSAKEREDIAKEIAELHHYEQMAKRIQLGGVIPNTVSSRIS